MKFILSIVHQHLIEEFYLKWLEKDLICIKKTTKYKEQLIRYQRCRYRKINPLETPPSYAVVEKLGVIGEAAWDSYMHEVTVFLYSD